MARFQLPNPFELYFIDNKNIWSLNTSRIYRSGLIHFCKFLELNKIDINYLSSENLTEFVIYLKNSLDLSPRTRLSHRKQVQRCLIYLCTKKYLKNDYHEWYPHYINWSQSKFELPVMAKDYLNLINAINKTTTRVKYRAILAHFHKFIQTEKIKMKKVNRKNIEKYLNVLYRRGLAPSTRIISIIVLKKYFHWLYEKKLLNEYPDILLSSKDLPKKQKRLPRPLEPHIDIEVQNKFKIGNDIIFDGLLLMRMTGLRASELINLSFDCLKKDHIGNYFLKVPLGKLNTERLVPLTQETTNLILKMKNISKNYTRNNLPWKLLVAPCGRQIKFQDIRCRMDEIQYELPVGTRATSHQLRHSCATDLLNHGMSIVALKEFLGHKDIRMTLNYTAVAPETMRHEYFKAIEKIQTNFKINSELQFSDIESIEVRISDLVLAIKKHSVIKNKMNILRSLNRILSQIK